MTFIDEAVVELASGDGGAGAVSFHREKHVPRGGPNGADGGRGGDVVLLADRNKRTLYDFRLKPRFEAGKGSNAVGNKRGRDGQSIELRLPVGTQVVDAASGEVLVDLVHDGMRHVLCRGGKGGFGNLHYVSSVRQVPTFAQKGAPGEVARVKLELKLLADVGLVGLPNAGKSTLLSRISAAKPRIADYPFTTVVPNLGVVSLRDTTFVVADLPGLIEGAAQGQGLGHRFLKHVERTRVLVHVVDLFPIDGSDPMANYRTVEEELRAYSGALYSRPRILALNKTDLAPPGELERAVEPFQSLGPQVFPISGATGEGLEPLLFAMLAAIGEAESEAPPTVVLAPARKHRAEGEWSAKKRGGEYVVEGERIVRLVKMTDLSNPDALHYLHRRLQRIGVIDKLRELGAEEGDTVLIGDYEFDYTDMG